MDVPLRLGELVPGHRDRLAEILRGTGAFSDDEVLVGIELFDAAMTSESSHDTDYSFLGAFTPEAELVGYACYGPTPGTDRVYDLYWIAVDARAHTWRLAVSLPRMAW